MVKQMLQGLGGASLHASRSGIACLIAEDEDEACALAEIS